MRRYCCIIGVCAEEPWSECFCSCGVFTCASFAWCRIIADLTAHSACPATCEAASRELRAVLHFSHENSTGTKNEALDDRPGVIRETRTQCRLTVRTCGRVFACEHRRELHGC